MYLLFKSNVGNNQIASAWNYKTVNIEGYQFAIVFPVTRENWEWWDFGFYQDWRNQDLTLKDLPISHEIILT